jgi:hypothetical protein
MNFKIIVAEAEKKKGYSVLFSNGPSFYGLYSCSVYDDTLTKVFHFANKHAKFVDEESIRYVRQIGEFQMIGTIRTDKITLDFLKKWRKGME